MPAETFAGMPACRIEDLRPGSVAVLGASHGSPYKPGAISHAARGPAALRAGSAKLGRQKGQFDFDTGRCLLADGGIVDCGDVPTDPADAEGNRARITEAVRRVLEARAIPLVLGGDDSIPIPMFGAYAGGDKLTMVQVDAHVDWGDKIQGSRWGYGSTMRRASEVDAVSGMVQVGIRGLGSGTPDQIEDARAWGSRIVTMPELRRHGMQAVVEAVSDGGDYFLSIDCDGLDPACMPAVNTPGPGGLTYEDLLALLQGLARRGRMRGCALVEFVPERDPNGLAALLAARIALTVAGLSRQNEGL